MGSANGMFLDRDKRPQERIVIDGERPIRIGHTYVRIRETGHAVEREREAGPQMRIVPIALAAELGIVILGIDGLNVWFAETAESQPSIYLVPLLSIAAAVVDWLA